MAIPALVVADIPVGLGLREMVRQFLRSHLIFDGNDLVDPGILLNLPRSQAIPKKLAIAMRSPLLTRLFACEFCALTSLLRLTRSQSDVVSRRLLGFRQHITRGLLPRKKFLVLIMCLGLSACGLSSQQRSAVIQYGHSLNDHGQLLAQETTFIRSEVKLTRVTMVSLPNTQSLALFNEGSYEDLSSGVSESRIQKLVQMGGAAGNFGKSLAQVADVTTSTAHEKIFSAAMREFVQVVGAVTEATSNVSLGAPVVNLVSYASTEAYRKRYLNHALPAAEPAIRAAHKEIDEDFDPDNPQSLLAVFAAATDRLAGMLHASERLSKAANLSAENREIVANAYRIVARNRDHIRYVTNRESELADKGASAYDALISAFNGDESKLATVDSYSAAVSQVRLAFESLK